jgi:pantothenate kinase-related protein Tda10
LLKPEEGRAITRSLDDYYLSKADRYKPGFLTRGYNPKGIPNRGPAGTHDTARLWNDIQAMDQGRSDLSLPSFNKQIDDHFPEHFHVPGKVGVLILEGWFVGARTDIDPMKVESGLKRSVAEALKNYQSIFARLDALWVFEPPKTLEQTILQRIEQEETLQKQTGSMGMDAEQICRFIHYFYEESWQSGLNSPLPPRASATFWAVTDDQHRFLKITPQLPLADVQ